jgi:NADPH:quinone reductase-like Zn-dependent oxidoreductase
MQMISVVELPGAGAGLWIRRRAIPTPAAGQALVRMEASGLSGPELRLARGLGAPAFPVVPGASVVGVVEALGSPRAAVSAGQRVAAVVGTGGWADRLLVRTADLVPVPDGVGAGEAAAVLLEGSTVRRMLADVCVGPRAVVVVVGAADGLASLVIQSAVRAGARVVAVTTHRHVAAVRELGATAVDGDGDLPAAIRGVAPVGADVVVDLGHPRVAEAGWMLRPGGALLAVGCAADRALPVVRSADLPAVLDDLATGEIVAPVARAFPLHRFADALAYADAGRAAGAVVLVGPDT